MAKTDYCNITRVVFKAGFVSLIILSSACTVVQPFQREILSKNEMQFDSESVELGAREHFINSIEGSSGGFGTGGGGCGCN